MGWTKKQLIAEAYGELALQDYVYDLDPEEMQTALRRLDAMMAFWNSQGINIGYPIPSNPDDSKLDDDAGIPDAANEPVFMNLAVRIAAGKGKQLQPSTVMLAKEGYDFLSSRSAMPPEVQFPCTMPRGAGNKPFATTDQRFMSPPCEPLTTQGETTIDFE